MTRSSDTTDQAADQAQAFLEACIHNQRHTAQQTQDKLIKPSGFCHYCNDRLNLNQLFCDDACKEDYVHEQKMRRINGRTVQ